MPDLHSPSPRAAFGVFPSPVGRGREAQSAARVMATLLRSSRSITHAANAATPHMQRVITTLASILLAACSSDDREARRNAAGPTPTREALLRVASASAGARIFARCAQCHAIRKGAPDGNGPNLHGVMNGPVAQASARFAYTAALQQVGGRWTAARMDAWLADPRAFAPGTSMRFPGLPDPLARADVIAYLQAQR